MSTIDLTIIGILLKQPMSAHEIVKYVDGYGISNMIKISAPAIYKSCKRLYKSEMLDGETIKKSEAPEKVVYTVNAKGKAYFVSLMENYSSEYRPFYLDFNVFMLNIENLEKNQALTMLESLRTQIKQTEQGILHHEKAQLNAHSEAITFSSKSIIKQYRMMYESLSQWIDETIDEYNNL